MTDRFQVRVGVVTGGSSGLGYGATERLITGATIELAGQEHFPEAYVREVEQIRSGPMITVNLATQKPLKGVTGIVGLDRTKNGRLGSIVYFTGTCPEMAPPGWHLYLRWAVRVPALADFDADAEPTIHRLSS